MRRAWVCLIIVCVAAACSRVNREAFEGVHRAGIEVELAIGSKADLPRYRQVLADFVSQLDIARARARSAADRQLVAQYETVGLGLEDMRLVWEARETQHSELLPVSDPVAGRIQKQYDLPVNTNEPTSIYAGEALQKIWIGTKKTLDAIAR